MDVVAYVLGFVSNGTWARPAVMWTPIVTASYTRDESLPADAERNALIRGVQFYRNARLMPTYQRAVWQPGRDSCSFVLFYPSSSSADLTHTTFWLHGSSDQLSATLTTDQIRLKLSSCPAPTHLHAPQYYSHKKIGDL